MPKYAERVLPPMLAEDGLFINHTKTERYNASRTSGTEWGKCKYLGPLLGTENDIKRRMVLTYNTIRSYEKMLYSRRLSEKDSTKDIQTICGKCLFI